MKVSDENILLKLNFEGLGWMGGKTTLQVSREIGLSESGTRVRLNKLEKAGKIYTSAPEKHRRLDGKTGNCLLWFLSSRELIPCSQLSPLSSSSCVTNVKEVRR